MECAGSWFPYCALCADVAETDLNETYGMAPTGGQWHSLVVEFKKLTKAECVKLVKDMVDHVGQGLMTMPKKPPVMIMKIEPEEVAAYVDAEGDRIMSNRLQKVYNEPAFQLGGGPLSVIGK